MEEWRELLRKARGAAVFAALALLCALLWRPAAPGLLGSWARAVVGPGRIPGLAALEVEALLFALAWAPVVLLLAAAGARLWGVAADAVAWGVLRRGLDVTICRGEWGWPVMVKEHDRWLHFLIVGPTGAGKSSRILKPMIEQDLRMMARWRKGGDSRRASMGVTVIEPKGDLVADVKAMAEEMGLPVVLVDPTDPESPHFNPLEGPTEEAAAERALQARALGYRHLRSILEKGLDRLPLEPEWTRVPVPEHANVRGAEGRRRQVAERGRAVRHQRLQA